VVIAMTSYHKSVINLGKLNKDDIPGLLALSQSVKWDYDEHDFDTIIKSGRVFGHRTNEGRIVSCSAIIPYDNKLATIGMVIVNKEFRGQGLGKEITMKCIEAVSKDTSIMLIATEEGKPLYEKLGFVTVDYIHKYLCKSYTSTKPITNSAVVIEEYQPRNFNEVVKIDEEAYGGKRSLFLRNRIHQSNQCLVVKDPSAIIIGYGLSISGSKNLILGPIVAPDKTVGAVLLDKLASGQPRILRIDVPSGNEAFRGFLENSGFKKVNKAPIMLLHSDTMPARNHTLFGIAAQIFG
jgi:predicted GNAT family N-acyltransferase